MGKGKSKKKSKEKTGERLPKEKHAKSERIQRVLDQAKEPLGLLETLKEEGMARAGYLLGLAAEMSKQVTRENIGSQIREVSGAVGIASKDEVRKLKARISELEERIEALETATGLTLRAAAAASDDEGEAEADAEAEENTGDDEAGVEDEEEVEDVAEALDAGELFEEEEHAEEQDPDDLN